VAEFVVRTAVASKASTIAAAVSASFSTSMVQPRMMIRGWMHAYPEFRWF
jgi:hypothetical protein